MLDIHSNSHQDMTLDDRVTAAASETALLQRNVRRERT